MRLEWAYPVPVHTISLSFRYFLNIFCRGTVPGYLYLCVYRICPNFGHIFDFTQFYQCEKIFL